MNIHRLIDAASTEQRDQALRAILLGLVDMGFAKDEPINGGDCVEAVAELFNDVIKRILKKPKATKG